MSCQSEKKVSVAEKSKPNIIYIMADDMGYGDVGCYGQKIIKTPNIDKLASEGMRFTQHYAGTAVCAPSRCALMTGMHMGHAEVRGNLQAEPSGQIPISDQTTTVAELLNDAGYTTGMIGKWGLGVEGTSGEPTKQGFDFYYGYLDQVLAHNYFPEYLLRNGEKEYLNNEVKYLSKDEWHEGLGSYSTKKEDYSHDFFEEETLKFIEENKDKSFFLYLPYTIPHDNGEAPDGQRLEIPDYGIYSDKDWGTDQKGYAAMVTCLDASVGKIVQKLKDAQIENNTLIIFTSDNGPEMSYYFSSFFDSNGKFRGGKRDLYEGGIREPFIAKWPGKIQPGSESNHISAFWDFLPTACEIAGVPVPDNTDGISYLPELTGKENQKEHDYLYWEFYERTGTKAVRKGKWKAAQNNIKTNPDSPIELYNLETDHGEQNNLASENPEIVAEMEAIMEQASTPSPVFIFE
jgi:arylsulfatase A-like enzyme